MNTLWLIAAGLYGSASIATFLVYWHDKRAAVRGGSRVPEKTLHGLEFLGGWPGALAAQQLIRHKNRKVRFFLVTWSIGLLHGAAWAVWLSAESVR